MLLHICKNRGKNLVGFCLLLWHLYCTYGVLSQGGISPPITTTTSPSPISNGVCSIPGLSPCVPAATCTPSQPMVGEAICICPPGYGGDGRRSDVGGTGCFDIDECMSNTHNCNALSEVCVNFNGGFMCECAPGYSKGANGGLNVCMDVDECTSGLNLCDPIQSFCYNTQGSYECVCLNSSKIFDMGLGYCRDIDHCTDRGGSLNPCSQNCSMVNSAPVCSCFDGYTQNTTDLTQCVDVDECATGVNSCDPYGIISTCTNIIGSYRCDCNNAMGYQNAPDGKSCINLDECSTDPTACGTAAMCCFDLPPPQRYMCLVPGSEQTTNPTSPRGFYDSQYNPTDYFQVLQRSGPQNPMGSFEHPITNLDYINKLFPAEAYSSSMKRAQPAISDFSTQELDIAYNDLPGYNIRESDYYYPHPQNKWYPASAPYRSTLESQSSPLTETKYSPYSFTTRLLRNLSNYPSDPPQTAYPHYTDPHHEDEQFIALRYPPQSNTPAPYKLVIDPSQPPQHNGPIPPYYQTIVEPDVLDYFLDNYVKIILANDTLLTLLLYLKGLPIYWILKIAKFPLDHLITPEMPFLTPSHLDDYYSSYFAETSLEDLPDEHTKLLPLITYLKGASLNSILLQTQDYNLDRIKQPHLEEFKNNLKEIMNSNTSISNNYSISGLPVGSGSFSATKNAYSNESYTTPHVPPMHVVSGDTYFPSKSYTHYHGLPSMYSPMNYTHSHYSPNGYPFTINSRTQELIRTAETILDNQCFKYNTEYKDLDVAPPKTGVEYASMCQSLCAAVSNCSYYSFNMRTSTCHFKSTAFTPFSSFDYISGPAQCEKGPETAEMRSGILNLGLTNMDAMPKPFSIFNRFLTHFNDVNTPVYAANSHNSIQITIPQKSKVFRILQSELEEISEIVDHIDTPTHAAGDVEKLTKESKTNSYQIGAFSPFESPNISTLKIQSETSEDVAQMNDNEAFVEFMQSEVLLVDPENIQEGVIPAHICGGDPKIYSRCLIAGHLNKSEIDSLANPENPVKYALRTTSNDYMEFNPIYIKNSSNIEVAKEFPELSNNDTRVSTDFMKSTTSSSFLEAEDGRLSTKAYKRLADDLDLIDEAILTAYSYTGEISSGINSATAQTVKKSDSTQFLASSLLSNLSGSLPTINLNALSNLMPSLFTSTPISTQPSVAASNVNYSPYNEAAVNYRSDHSFNSQSLPEPLFKIPSLNLISFSNPQTQAVSDSSQSNPSMQSGLFNMGQLSNADTPALLNGGFLTRGITSMLAKSPNKLLTNTMQTGGISASSANPPNLLLSNITDGLGNILNLENLPFNFYANNIGVLDSLLPGNLLSPSCPAGYIYSPDVVRKHRQKQVLNFTKSFFVSEYNGTVTKKDPAVITDSLVANTNYLANELAKWYIELASAPVQVATAAFGAGDIPPPSMQNPNLVLTNQTLPGGVTVDPGTSINNEDRKKLNSALLTTFGLLSALESSGFGPSSPYIF